jgi:hypothetical protein
MYYYTALLITVSLQLATRHFRKYLVALGTNLFFWETHLGVFGASPRSFGWHLGGPRSQPLSLCDAPPNLGESLAGGALLVVVALLIERTQRGEVWYGTVLYLVYIVLVRSPSVVSLSYHAYRGCWFGSVGGFDSSVAVIPAAPCCYC